MEFAGNFSGYPSRCWSDHAWISFCWNPLAPGLHAVRVERVGLHDASHGIMRVGKNFGLPSNS